MPFRPDRNGGNKAVTLLATCLVVLAGAATCAAIGMSADTTPQKQDSLRRTGIATGGIVLLLWLLRERPRENQAKQIWGWLGRKKRRKVAYRVAPRIPRGEHSAPVGPPTPESVRALAAGQNAWVPATTAPPDSRRERPRDKSPRRSC